MDWQSASHTSTDMVEGEGSYSLTPSIYASNESRYIWMSCYQKCSYDSADVLIHCIPISLLILLNTKDLVNRNSKPTIQEGADKSLAFPISPTFRLIILLSHQSLLFRMSDLNFIIVAWLFNYFADLRWKWHKTTEISLQKSAEQWWNNSS
jgi:hypothetical protein